MTALKAMDIAPRRRQTPRQPAPALSPPDLSHRWSRARCAVSGRPKGDRPAFTDRHSVGPLSANMVMPALVAARGSCPTQTKVAERAECLSAIDRHAEAWRSVRAVEHQASGTDSPD